ARRSRSTCWKSSEGCEPIIQKWQLQEPASIAVGYRGCWSTIAKRAPAVHETVRASGEHLERTSVVGHNRFPLRRMRLAPSCFARFYNSSREFAIDRVYQAIP